jgi:hypothetical protein
VNVSLTGCGTDGYYALTNSTGDADITVNATSSGTINVDANLSGYTDGKTTLTAQ